MYTLILLRHAKAVRSIGDDFSRDLTDAGDEDATRVGMALRKRALVPDLALVSPAARTRRTFEAVRSASDGKMDVCFVDALYEATSRTIRDLIGAVDPAVGTLMVVGHNPAIAEGVATLARDGDLPAIDRLRSGFKPCSLAVLTFDAPGWREATRAGGHLALLLTPEDLAA